MIEVVVFLIVVCFSFAAGYHWGFADGEKSMFRRFTSQSAAGSDEAKEKK
jgi:hypothetical protein